MGTLYMLTVIVTGGWLIAVILIRHAKHKRLTLFDGRESIAPITFLKPFCEQYSLRIDDCIFLWKEISLILEIPQNKLRLTDRFTVELRSEGNNLHDDEIDALCDYASEKVGGNYDIFSRETVGDVLKDIVLRKNKGDIDRASHE